MRSWSNRSLGIGAILLLLVGASQCNPLNPGSIPNPSQDAIPPGHRKLLRDDLWLDPYLPDFIVPIHYDLYLNPNFYFDGSTYQGRVEIDLEVCSGDLARWGITLTGVCYFSCFSYNGIVCNAI